MKLLKKILNDKFVWFNRYDFIIFIIFVLFCSFYSFQKLGNYKSPNTFYRFSDDIITIDLKKQTDIRKIMIFNGDRESDYNLYVSENNNDYELLTDYNCSGSFSWDEIKLKYNKVRYIKLDFYDDASIGEIGVYDNTGLIKDTYITNSKKMITELNDEQEMVPFLKSYMNSSYFDEVYFARCAYEYIHNINIYEWTHPPLGKTLISVGIRIFGMNPFGWRFTGTLMGVLLVPILYLFALKLLKRSNFAFIAAFLLAFDFMRTAQTRLATIDTYSVFFTVLMYYFMYDYFSKRSYDLKFFKSLLPLLLSGICFGLGAACKWTSIYSGVGLAILFFAAKLAEAADVNTGRAREQSGKGWFFKNFLPTCGACVIFFILIPAAIYTLSYLPYMASNPDKTIWKVMLDNQKAMYNYHSGLNSTHPYQSSWYSWILDLRPIYYSSSGDAGLPSGIRASVASFGNPAVWWVGLACLPVAVYFTWKRRERGMLVAFIGYACQLFPWILVTRCTFIYHYFTSVPFLIILLVYVIKCLYEDKIIGKPTIFIYMGIVLLLYILFYPVLTAIPVKDSYISDLRWFNSWSF